VSRTLSTPLNTAAGQPVTQPGYLIELYLPISGVARITTFGDVTWNGYSWVSTNVKVNGIGRNGAVTTNASLLFPNTDNAWSSIAFGVDDLRDARVVIYSAYADALANEADVICEFDGVGDEPMMANPPALTLKLAAAKSAVSRSPRRRISAPLFNALQPLGTQVTIGNTIYVLNRDLK